MAVAALGLQLQLPSMIPHSQAIGILTTAATPRSPTSSRLNSTEAAQGGSHDGHPAQRAVKAPTATAGTAEGGHSHSNSRTSSSPIQGFDGGSPRDDSESCSSKGKRDATGGTKGGAGISQEELGRLDPKRAKRIMANRLSAARSKERKLRYIAELQEKVANLQNEVNSMMHQLRGLCDDTATLGKTNEQLLGQVVFFQEQIRVQDQETEALMWQMDCLKGVHKATSPASSVTPWNYLPSSRPSHSAAFSMSPFASGPLPWEQPGSNSQGLGRGLQLEAPLMAPQPSLGSRHSSLDRRNFGQQGAQGSRPAFPGGRSLSVGAGSLAGSIRGSPQQRGLVAEGPRGSFPGAHRNALSQGPRQSYEVSQQGFGGESSWGNLELPPLRRQSVGDAYSQELTSATGSGLSSTTQLSRYDSMVDPGLLEMLRLEDMYGREEQTTPHGFPRALPQQQHLSGSTQGHAFPRPQSYQKNQAQVLQELLSTADPFGQTLQNQRLAPLTPEAQAFSNSLLTQAPPQLSQQVQASPAWGVGGTASINSLTNPGGVDDSLAHRFLPPAALPSRASLGLDTDATSRDSQPRQQSSWQLFPSHRGQR